jgi:hypothetical protein
MLKYLRIAVTALCLTACVLLIALWVRSYWRTEIYIGKIFSWSFEVAQDRGSAGSRMQQVNPQNPWPYGLHSYPAGSFEMASGIGIRWGEGVPRFWFPHWIAVLMTTLLGVAPWLPWSRRFSLRALLIATTLVAVGLGAIALLN